VAERIPRESGLAIKNEETDRIDGSKALHGSLREPEKRKIGTADVLPIDFVP
jgi:hypothetical protein